MSFMSLMEVITKTQLPGLHTQAYLQCKLRPGQHKGRQNCTNARLVTLDYSREACAQSQILQESPSICGWVGGWVGERASEQASESMSERVSGKAYLQAASTSSLISATTTRCLASSFISFAT